MKSHVNIESESEFKKETSPIKNKANIELTQQFTGITIEEVISNEKETEHIAKENPTESKAFKSITPHHTALQSETLPEINLGNLPNVEFPAGRAKVDNTPFQEVIVTETNITETETTLDTIKPELKTATVGIRSGESFLVSEVVAEDREDVFKSAQLPESRKATLNLSGQEVAEHEEIVELIQEGTWERQSPVKEQASMKQDTIQLAVASQEVPSELEGQLDAPIKPTEKVAAVLFVEGHEMLTKPSQPPTMIQPSSMESQLEEASEITHVVPEGEVLQARDVVDELSEAVATKQEIHKVPKKPLKKKKVALEKPVESQEEPTVESVEIEVEKVDQSVKTEEEVVSEEVYERQPTTPKTPEKIKLQKQKLEVKEVKPQKLKIQETKDETPQFATIKLKKASVAEKKDTKPTTQLPKVMLKSRIKRIPYPPEAHYLSISNLDAVVDNGVLSRNYEEAIKIKKKKIKKVKLPEVEKTELEEYVPFKGEAEKSPQNDEEIEEKDSVVKDIPLVPEEEKISIKIGKGRIPELEESVDSVTLKKVTPKKGFEKASTTKSPKTLKPSTETPQVEEEELTIKMAQIKPYEPSKPTDIDSLEHIPVEEKAKEETPEVKLKKPKKVPEKIEIVPDAKKLVLGKPKEKPEEEEDDVSFKYKQKELPKQEPEEIQLKPFTKEEPTGKDLEENLTVSKPVYPEEVVKDEEVIPKEIEAKDKTKKKIKKKKPLEKPEEAAPVVESTVEPVELQPEILEEVEKGLPQTVITDELANEEKPQDKVKPKLIKIERLEQKATKLKVEDVKPEQLFSTIKLRKSSVVPKKEPKPTEVKKFLLKSLIKRVPFPPQEQIPIITTLQKVEVDKGVLSRNYEEALKVKKPKHKKVKLSEPEKTELEKYEPTPEYVKTETEPESVSVKKPKELTKVNDVPEEKIKLKIGKGVIPDNDVEGEVVTLKKIPAKSEEKDKDDQITSEEAPVEHENVKKEIIEKEVDLGSLSNLDIPEPTKEVETVASTTTDEVPEKPTKPSKKQKQKLKKEEEIVDEKQIVLGKGKKKPIQEEDSIILKKPKPKEPEEVTEEKVVLKPFDKPYEDSQQETLTIKKTKVPQVEEMAQDFTITIKEDIPVEKIEEHASQEFSIKKKKPKTIVQEDVSEEITIRKKKPSFTPQEDVSEEVVIKKKSPKTPYLVEESSEELTIKQEHPSYVIGEESISEKVIMRRGKPILKEEEDISEEFVIKPKRPSIIPQVTEDVEEELVLKKKKKPKTQAYEEAAEELTITQEAPIPDDKPEVEDSERMVVVLKKTEKPVEETEQITIMPRRRSSVRKPSLEEHPEEKITLKQRRPSEDVVEEEITTDVTFKPKVTKPKEEIEQEFKISLQTYEEEDISMSGKVRLPRKKKIQPVSDEASAEMTIQKEVDVDQGQDVNFALRGKSITTYNVEDIEQEVQLGLRQQQHRASIVCEEETLDIKVKRKPSIPVFSQESAGLTITREEDVTVLKGEKILETTEGDTLFSICSYVAENDDALNLVEGEKVYVLESTSQDWWFVQKHLTEEKGWVPAVYLRDEPSYTLYVQKKLHEKIDKLPIFEKPTAGEEVYAPRFVEKLQPKHVPDGATVQFECQVEGNPRPQITWFRQTAIIKPSQDFQIFYDEDCVATLIIREIFPEDAGTFTCVAKNAAGFASSTTELLVEAPLSDHGSDITGHSRKSLSRESSLADILEGIPPTFSRKPKAKIVKEGENVNLECRLVAVPEPDIFWSYKGSPVKPSDTVSVTTQSDMHMYSTMVSITNVQKSQEGVYQVVAKNREGQTTLDIILKVKTGEPEAPEVVEPLQDVCISEGESAVLATQITGKPTPKIVWSKDGNPDSSLPTKVQGETYSLTLIKPSPSDSARYTVKATNKHGSAQTSCQLIVERVPGPQAPLFVERFEEQNVKEKGTIRLVAKVTGNPVPIVTWFRNNKTLLASPKQNQLFDGENIVLEIKEADSEEDAGDYKCVASNNLGTATHGSRVTVDVEKVLFTKKLQERVEINESETVTLECETSHTVSTKWRHNDVELSGMDHRELVQEGRNHRLVIKRATLRDVGTYTCSVKDQVTSTTVVIHGMKPDFVRKLEDFEVKEQEVAILEVEISSETADVVWVKDGLPLEPTPGKLEVEKKGNIRKLLIRSTSVHDEGEYTCTLGDQECTAEVTVIELPPQIHTSMQDVTVTSGDKAILEVELTKGDALVRWFKDDKELHFSEHVQLSIDGKKQKLKIYQAELTDGGTYSCRVGDQPDQVSSARVTVEEPAVSFIKKLPEVTLVADNTDAEFTVELSQSVDVKWFRKSKEIKPSSKYIIKSEGTTHTLVIKKATSEDQTDIACAAANVKTSSKLKVEKVEIAPKIKMDDTPKEYKVKKGEDVNIEVKFSASPPPTDEWTVNGTVVVKNKRVGYTLGEESACLTIKKVEEVDVGTYTLRLKNSVGEASVDITLIIMQVPGEPGAPDVLEVTDDSVTLHWKAPESDGNSPITRYILEFHDKEEFMEWHEVTETLTVTTHTVTNLKHDADIMFRVSAENEVGKGPHSHNTRYVKISTPVDAEPPVIQEPLQDSTVGFGKSITLECVIGGTPLPEVKWFKNGKAMKSKKMSYENRVATFTLSECSDSASATYSCKATNSAGSAETSCKLIVQDVPKVEVPEAIQNQRLNLAAQWKPEVTFSGYPRPEVTWEKNGQQLQSDKKCKIFIDETTTTIAIYSVERTDTATYTVRAVNTAGSASADLVLKVIDKPGKPEGPITFSNMVAESITVEWRPPLDDGGLELTKYILEKCEASKLIWTKAADVDGLITSYTVDKLIENTEYMFRVLAQNSVGTSEALTSEPVIVRTIYNKPSPPQGPLEASGMTETSCTIRWHAPADDGGTPILDYTVHRKETTKKSWQKLSAVTELALSMSDLVLNQAYVFKITARNKAGESEPYVSEDPIVAGRKITPPSAPLNFNAINITSKSVTLQWTPPSSTGGTDLTGYIIEKQYGGSKSWSKVVTLDPGHLEYCVENLKEKSELYFRIYAENSIGLSTAAATSVISLKTHATVPSPPTDPLEIRSLGPNSIIVEWGVPETDGGAPLEGYKIAIRDVKKTMWMEVGQVTAEVQKLTIKDLQENHEYLVRIFARNEVGLSDPLESDEPFLVRKPTGMEEADVEERSLLEKDTPSLSFSTETTTSWMREAGMDADIKSYARGSLLRRSEYFFRVWYYAKHLFK